MGAIFGGKDACYEARLYHEDLPELIPGNWDMLSLRRHLNKCQGCIFF